MATYLSQLIGRPVWNADAVRLGKCVDVLVLEADAGTPGLCALQMLRNDGAEVYLPASQISTLSPAIILTVATPDAYEPRGEELYLRKQVLDRQIVDVEGHRLVRVNDLQLLKSTQNGRYFLTGVSIGAGSLLRRLGIESLGRRALLALNRPLREQMIPWQVVAPVHADAPIRLRVTQDKISQVHPVDMADIISDLDRSSGVTLLQMLGDETAADIISEVEPELQTWLLASLAPERAADVLEEMDPDDAADLLGALEETQRESYLELMDPPESVEMVKLLAHPEDTAGGIMTTEYTTLPLGYRVDQALAYLRESPQAQEDETLYYVHIVDDQNRLRGLVSLRDLVMAAPEALVDEVMQRNVITTSPMALQHEVARMVARYNLLEVPVVDAKGVLMGIVTVDDAIDAVIPTAWKKRLPRFY